jgi:Xaa-Pro aminopeptidase
MHCELNILRQEMRTEKIDAVIFPTSDPHNSEYLPEHWQTRQWITGFTGSAGTAVVTLDEAALWTDSRYFIQAEMELRCSSRSQSELALALRG